MRSGITVTCVLLGFSLVVVTSQSQPTFEVSTIKRPALKPVVPPSANAPEVFYRPVTTLFSLISFAYAVSREQIVGAPDWAATDRYELYAKAAAPIPAHQLRPMVQRLLAERFALRVSWHERTMKYQALVTRRTDGRLGPQLSTCTDPSQPTRGKPTAIPRGAYPVPLQGSCSPIAALATALSQLSNRLVLDRTGLDGLYTYELVFAETGLTVPTTAPAEPSSLPSLRDGLQDLLGLTLESREGAVPVVVVESAREPSDN